MAGFGNRKPLRSGTEKRRAFRSKANAPAIVQTTATRMPVTISDISATGARVVSSRMPPTRQDVQLYVNGLWLFGTIAWRREKAFGVKFEDGLHDYSPGEIHEAVEQATEQNTEFDREAVLSELMNQEPSDNHNAEEANAG